MTFVAVNEHGNANSSRKSCCRFVKCRQICDLRTCMNKYVNPKLAGLLKLVTLVPHLSECKFAVNLMYTCVEIHWEYNFSFTRTSALYSPTNVWKKRINTLNPTLCSFSGNHFSYLSPDSICSERILLSVTWHFIKGCLEV